MSARQHLERFIDADYRDSQRLTEGFRLCALPLGKGDVERPDRRRRPSESLTKKGFSVRFLSRSRYRGSRLVFALDPFLSILGGEGLGEGASRGCPRACERLSQDFDLAVQILHLAARELEVRIRGE